MSVVSVHARVQSIQARIASLDPVPGAQATPARPPAGPGASPFAADLQQQLVGAAAGPASGTGPAAALLTTGSGVTAGAAGLGEPSPYDAEIVAAAREAGVSPALLKAMCRSESGFNPRAVSHAGAQGLMQLMPATARGLGVTDPFDPTQSLRGGARYLRGQLDRFGGDVEKAVAAYNAGPGAVQRHGGVPPYRETQTYVRRVLDLAARYGGLAAGSSPVAPATAATAAAPTAPPGYTPVMMALVPVAAPASAASAVPAATTQPPAPSVQAPSVPASSPTGEPAAPAATTTTGERAPATPTRVLNHVGLYVGEGRFLHAPRTGDVVKVSGLDEPSYAARIAGARRHASGGAL